MNREHVEELLYQTLETEKGGIQVYETALKCAVNDELKKEWGKYLEHWELIHRAERPRHDVLCMRSCFAGPWLIQ